MRMRRIHKSEFSEVFEGNLKRYMLGKGFALHVAANDNGALRPAIVIRDIRDGRPSHYATGEIEVLLEIIGLPWESGLIINRIYEAVGPGAIELENLLVLMMEMSVLTFEVVLDAVRSYVKLRYAVEAR